MYGLENISREDTILLNKLGEDNLLTRFIESDKEYQIFVDAPDDSVREQMNKDVNTIVGLIRKTLRNSDGTLKGKVIKGGVWVYFLIPILTIEATGAAMSSRYLLKAVRDTLPPLKQAVPAEALAVYSKI